MSYQVLARKWRPNRFDEVVGQQHVLQALVNALEQQRLHHAYLFSGTRGVGKTSIARLLAKCLNCEVAVSATPCGECESCREIEQGRFIDLIEIDAASRTKVEDTREILDNVQYKPTRARYKIYLIDEVHMLSRSSFNALLKTLEEPPEHVKFLFATTETQKLPVTILSRCLQFNLKALSPRQIAGQLTTILDAEAITYDDGALSLLSQRAKGSMRDALSLTDQAISHGSGKLSSDVVGQMLGTIDVDHSAKLLNLALTGQSEALFKHCDDISQLSPDFDALLGQMIDSVHFASMAKVVKNSARLAQQPRTVIELAQFDSELLQLFYSLLLQGRKELSLANDPQSGFEMVLLRLLAFMPAPVTALQHHNIDGADTDAEVTTQLANEQASLMAQADVLRNTPAQQGSNASQRPAGPNGLAQVKAALKQSGVNQQSSEPVINSGTDNIAQTPKKQTDATVNVEMAAEQPAEQIDAVNTESQADGSLISNESKEKSRGASPAPIEQPSAVTQQLEPKLAEQHPTDTPQTPDFSEEELMNMSMAMAHEEQDYHEPIDINQSPVPTATPQEVPATVNATAPVGNINAFLAAKNKLKSQRDKDSGEGENVKKPQAVNDQLVQSKAVSLPNNDHTGDVIEQRIESLPVVDDKTLVAATKTIPTDINMPEQAPVALMEDPALLLAPNSEDPWTLMIEAMALGGRLRQLAIHSVYTETDNQINLLLANEHRHLNADTAIEALTKKISLLKDKPIAISVEIGDNDVQTPFEIAQDLHHHRLKLAAERIKDDEGINNFINQFDANLVTESIKYRTLKAIS